MQWLHRTSETLGLRHIAIDGKTLRHSGGGSSPLHYLHLVSAWATEANLTLGQVAVEEKSNEITAIPRLLELLDLHGALVSIDAMGCQKEIAKKIVERGGDYVLTVKDNQEQLKSDILACFIKAYDNDCQDAAYKKYETEEEGHGRQEKRVYEILYDLGGVRDREAWAELKVIGKCYSERTVRGRRATRSATSSAASGARPSIMPGRCGVTGGSRTACIGRWMSPSGRTPAGYRTVRAGRTSPCCGVSPWGC